MIVEHKTTWKFLDGILKGASVIVLRVRHVNYNWITEYKRIESGKVTNAQMHLSSNWRGKNPDYISYRGVGTKPQFQNES